jgi:hypothetical protein
VGLRHVTVGAFNGLASELVFGVAVVEASEPKSAHISGEGPLTNPDGVFEVLDAPVSHVGTVAVAVGANVVLSCPPGHVLVSVNDDVLHVVISEEVVPLVGPGQERVMEDEEHVGVDLTDNVSAAPVEVLEDLVVGGPPGLIDRLKSVDSGVMAPLVHEVPDVFNAPVDVIVVDGVVVGSVEVTHPGGVADAPVLEVVLVGPLKIGGLAGVVEAILGVDEGMNVKQNLEAILGGGVEEPLNLLGSTVSASDVGSVRGEGPVTDGETDDLDFTVGEGLDVFFGDP